MHSRIQFPFCNSLVLKNLSLVSESFQQFGKGLDTKANILITILALVVTFIYWIYFMCIPCADAFIGFALKCANLLQACCWTSLLLHATSTTCTWHHSLEATTHVTSPLVYNGSSLTSYTICRMSPSYNIYVQDPLYIMSVYIQTLIIYQNITKMEHGP